MRDPLSRDFSALQSTQDSWIHRVRENFHQLLAPARIFSSAANGAPLHLLSFERSETSGSARTASLLTHAALLSGILLLNFSSRVPGPPGPPPDPIPRLGLTFFPIPEDSHFGRPSLGKKSGGGEEDPRPARHGLLPPGSFMPLAPPRLPLKAESALAVPVSVLDPNAPQFPAPVTDIGLSWMKEDSDSAGPGRNHGMGSGKNGGVGDDDGPGAGQGEAYNGRYANVASLPSCAYCPDPEYTDEAREAKLQGHVLLKVLVGADGRASQVRIVQGIGLGLDERAAQAIRGWKFVPGQDASRRPVSAWITVEAIFRLF
jgi:periplasmic protein TonB